LIAGQIGEAADHKLFSERAMTIKQQMNKHLWNEELGRYTNICIATDQPITFISYAAFIPLWSGIPSQSNAERTIKDFLLSEEQLLSKFGFRTLSKQDPRYNNANIIKPHSNWQGPVWPIVNYLYMHGILRYGFQKEAIAIANNISDLVLADIDRTGGMHENYDAETGLDLAAPNFISWNILVRNMLAEAVGSANPFEIEEL